jgi:hypothetical protein
MKEDVLNAGLLGILESERAPEREGSSTELRTIRPPRRWNPDDFAREQIHGLVRKVFFSSNRPVRQVVFSAVDSEADVRHICRRVAETLARETVESVAVLSRRSQAFLEAQANLGRRSEPERRARLMPLHRIADRLRDNLWLVPALGGGDSIPAASLHSYLGEMRREFAYSILEAAPAGESNQTAAMAQFADGVILVLTAHRTRRLKARKVKESLEAAQTRILGTVLSDRMFPIPEKLYRRL